MNNLHSEDIPTLRSFLKDLIYFLKFNAMVLLGGCCFSFFNMSLNQSIVAIYEFVIIFPV